MEALRIVAMSMILCGHFVTHAIKNVSPSVFFYSEALFIDGVNLFFLISGWFGIRFSMRSFVRLVCYTAFFSMVSLLLLYLAGGQVTDYVFVERLKWPISRSGYWFIMVYALLMIVSPFLNAGLRQMSNRQISAITVLLTIYCIYGGHWGGNYTNPTGYTITQAIWLYVLAHWLRLNNGIISRINRNWFLVGFVVATVIIFIRQKFFGHSQEIFHYNSPMTVLSSLTLFLFFTRLKFRSAVVNAVAPAAFGCYMIQDGVFGHKFLYAEITRIYSESRVTIVSPETIAYLIGFLSALFVGYWCLSIVLTPVADRLSRYAGDFVEYVGRRLGKLRP